MATIRINETDVECQEGVPVLQVALEMGLDVPHYCYHPGLSIAASCRLCLMEMKMPHPKTRELDWAPKLVPSCQTPARDGMEVRFDSEKVRQNQRNCMEFFLLNHPLDCPVCDQAGECHLQDYSYHFGSSTSRMVDQKHVSPKKDIGPKTLLYSDRCVMCTRCVRFADEIAGTGELGIVNRGYRNEIDVFPGKPLDNPIQGNVVDICPVGCLLDKDFLFKKRVWHLRRGQSICPGCSTGCAIHVDHWDDRVYRLKPRFNPGVNDWWMCDEGRFGFKYIEDPKRLKQVRRRRGEAHEPLDWDSAAQVACYHLREIAAKQGAEKIAVVLSPFLACEEAWLLASAVRKIAPMATLVLGFVPTVGQDQRFPVGATNGDAKFVIRAERCPNRRGIERIIESLGGPTATLDEWTERAGAGEFAAAWITGGYPSEWASKELAKAIGKVGWLVVQDLFPSALSDAANLLLPISSFAERSGSYMNSGGKVQPFAWAIRPPDGCRRDGQFLLDLAREAGAVEMTGMYHPGDVRERMATSMAEFDNVAVPPPMPPHQH